MISKTIGFRGLAYFQTHLFAEKLYIYSGPQKSAPEILEMMLLLCISCK